MVSAEIQNQLHFNGETQDAVLVSSNHTISCAKLDNTHNDVKHKMWISSKKRWIMQAATLGIYIINAGCASHEKILLMHHVNYL